VQIVDRPEEGREGLAGAGGRGNQDVLGCPDPRPSLALGRAGLAEALAEPALDEWMEGRERHQPILSPPARRRRSTI
jgi:hypothetical protein